MDDQLEDRDTRITQALADSLAGDRPAVNDDLLLHEWLADHGIHHANHTRLDALQVPQIENINAWTAVERRIATRHGEASPKANSKAPRGAARFWAAIPMASAAVLIVIGAWMYTARNALRTGNAVVRTITTQPGERIRTQLPDGSTVLLGPDSRIQYTETFGTQDRHIKLDGQALFTVTHTEATPFRVTIGRAVVQVLGTTFAVRQYAADSISSVIVAEGKVSVAPAQEGSEPMVVTTGEAATVSSSGSSAHTTIANLSAVLGWTQGRLVFTKTPLRDVAVEVARMYGVSIGFASKALEGQQFTGQIDQRTSDEAIGLLAAAAGARMERTETGYLLMEND